MVDVVQQSSLHPPPPPTDATATITRKLYGKCDAAVHLPTHSTGGDKISSQFTVADFYRFLSALVKAEAVDQLLNIFHLTPYRMPLFVSIFIAIIVVIFIAITTTPTTSNKKNKNKNIYYPRNSVVQRCRKIAKGRAFKLQQDRLSAPVGWSCTAVWPVLI